MGERGTPRWLAWLGWGLEQVGVAGVAAWAGASAGWGVLAIVTGSDAWLGVLVALFGIYVGLPGVLLRAGGRALARRFGAPPRPARVAGWVVAGLVVVAAAVWAYVGGWPR